MAPIEPGGIIELAAGGKSARPATFVIDNSLLGKTLSLTLGSERLSSVTLEYPFAGETFKTTLPYEKKSGQLKIRATELLMALPPNSRGKLLIKIGGKNRVIGISRKGALPEKFKDLAPLYQQIAKDIKEKGSFIVSVPVVLWDASFTGEGFDKKGNRRFWADGSDPENNLNWGGATGIYTQLLEVAGWELVSGASQMNGPLRQAVFAKKFDPNQFWKRMGVTKPFTVYFAAMAYDYREIMAGYQQFSRLVNGKSGEKITLPDGKTLDLDESRIVGLGTHYIPQGRSLIGELSSSTPKGVFIASCFGATNFGPLVTKNNLYPLLLSIPQTSSEAYIYTPLIEGIISGKGLAEMLSAVSKSYYKFHGVYTGEKQYVNPTTSNFEAAISKYSLDWDGDKVSNEIDPEPESLNPFSYDRASRQMNITLSNSQIVSFPMNEAQYFRYIAINN